MADHSPVSPPYRGRLAPSPTGWIHLGHAQTFWTAHLRAAARDGVLVYREEDLDPSRCQQAFAAAALDDLRWLGLQWSEGPDVGGPCGPYRQSERRSFYRDALRRLVEGGHAYPCSCSRKDVERALGAPHAGDEEPVYPGTCRPPDPLDSDSIRAWVAGRDAPWPSEERRPFERRINWRFRVPDGRVMRFHDGRLGAQAFEAGRDFGDFVLWRHDDTPSYQLAVTADDAAMGITEVVRGADLAASTARQGLIYEALGWALPAYYHAALRLDAAGRRLAKRHGDLSLRSLRARGMTAEEVRAKFED